MLIELTIPEIGESIAEVQVAEWLKAEGDPVQKGEPVAIIDSEKTTLELPAPEDGTLARILHQAGAIVKVGEVIAHVEPGAVDGDSAPSKSKAAPDTKPETQAPASGKGRKAKAEPSESAPGEATAVDTRSDGAGREKAESTEARAPKNKRAEPKPAAAPSEESDAPTQADRPESAGESEPQIVKPATRTPAKPAAPPAAKAPEPGASADGEEEIVPMSMLRRTVARRLVEAKQQMAMLTTFNEVDMSAVQALRREHQDAFEKRYRVKLGFMSFFVKAAVDALRQFPMLNAEVRGTDIVYRNYFNIGVAIATGRGLVVPVLRRAGRLSFAEVETSIGDFAGRARDGKLKPDELDGASFTITNGGVFGSLLSTPIISPPQSGILGMHTIQERPVAIEGQVVIRPMMYVALTYDHRIVDGREAVLFTRRIKEAIESPARLLLEV
jgi:2-oxoglutarate dehydrogenase E2 component (dihydrolipoamide succinyltransferase)